MTPTAGSAALALALGLLVVPNVADAQDAAPVAAPGAATSDASPQAATSPPPSPPTPDAPPPLATAPSESAPSPTPSPMDALGTNLSVRAAVFSHDRDFGDSGSVETVSARARISPRLSGSVDGFFEGAVEDDTAHGVRDDLLEGWLHVMQGPFEVKLGREIQIWGRADQLNPTDNLSSRDYTELVADETEQRRGVGMAQVRLDAGAFTVDGFWLPEFRANQFPLDRRTPGVTLLPDQSQDGSRQYAFKIDHSGGKIDWSVSWYDGLDHDRELALTGITALGQLAVQQQYAHIQVLGADLAGVRGPISYRAEFAFTHVASTDSPFRIRDNVWLVAGADTTLPTGWNINLQYSYRAIVANPAPTSPNPAVRAVAALSEALNNQNTPVQNGVTLRLGQKWFNDALSLDLSFLSYFETHDGVLRPKISYAITDNLRLTFGADVLYGPNLSQFGYARRLSGAFTQLTAGY